MSGWIGVRLIGMVEVNSQVSGMSGRAGVRLIRVVEVSGVSGRTGVRLIRVVEV